MAFPRLPLKEIARAALQTLLRFPFTLLSAFLGTAMVWRLIELEYDSPNRDTLTKIAISAALGLILFFVLELVSQRKRLRPILRWGLTAVGVGLLAVYFFSLPDTLFPKHAVRYLLWMLALHLVASFAAFWNWRTENGFWQFNKSLFLRLLTALLYSGVLYVGLVLAILAFDQLFDVEIDSEVYPKLWMFMVGVFNTWFFLAGVPNPSALEQVTDYPKGLKLFTQFVLLPLVTLYLLILYGYMGKILLQGEWPRGWVSYLVLGFSTAGIFSLLLIHPIRLTEGNRWISTYAKWFYRALFPLLILLLLAIWRRVSDYGITENRYIVLALALWLLVVAIYFLFSRQKNIKFIPMTLAGIAFFAAFGPWGAFAVSKQSQTQRLEALLQEHHILVDGKIQVLKGKISQKDEFEIGSILNYLGNMHQYETVKPWFGASLDSLFEENPKYGNGTPSISEIMALMNLEYRYSLESESNTYFSMYVEEDEVLLVSGYDYQVKLRDTYRRDSEEKADTYVLGDEKLEITVDSKENKVKLNFRNENVVLSLDSLVQKRRAYNVPVPAKQLQFSLDGKSFGANLQITRLSAEKEKNGDRYKLNDVAGRLLVKLEEPEKK